jgi:TolA-binding protein
MKKYLSITLIFISLLLAGCGQDQYATEKQFYRIQKQAGKIFRNPDATPANELQNAVKALKDFSIKYPKTNLAAEAKFTIANLYIIKKEYEKSRQQINKIIDEYKKVPAVTSEAVFLKGNSYETQGQWEQALIQYKKVMQTYPLSRKGLEAPIYIASHYKVKFQPDKMMEAFRQAINHYNGLASKYPNTPAALQLDTLAAQCYAAMQDWPNAAAAYRAITRTYKGKVNMDGLLVNIALIYSRKLNDNQKAKQMLNELIKDYPRSNLIPAAKKLLKELGN